MNGTVLPTQDPAWQSGAGLRTPFVAVHSERLRANIDRIAHLGQRHALRVRPHAKTHKCIEIARLQVEAGAVGITVAKPGEARVFLRAGIPSVTLAYPVIDSDIVRELLDEAAARRAELHFVVDSEAGLNALRRAAAGRSAAVGFFVEIDVGLHRCGVTPGSPLLAALADATAPGNGVRFAGILSHAGHAYGAGTPEGVATVAQAERLAMNDVARALRASGIEVPCISVGSTPTVCLAPDFGGMDEIRPGNYVFFDRTAMRLGAARPDEIALAVFATVVSVNDTTCIIDAGSKSLSSDLGPHGTGGDMGHGEAWAFETADPGPWRVARLSEEHGFIPHQGRPLPIGTRLMIVPNHSCPVANLADALVVLSAHAAPRTWAVDARGKTS